jgi:hypothetical protein
MKTKKLKLLIVVLTTLFFFQCSNEFEEDLIEQENLNELQSKKSDFASKIGNNNKIQPDQMMRLGIELKNPYSVENMQIAYNSLKRKQQGFDKINISIKANFIYLRALPKDEGELDLLKDLGYELYEYPLDVQILEEGSFYKDSNLTDEQIPWQYFVVPVNFDYPNNIQYERLDNLYLPEEEKEINSQFVSLIQTTKIGDNIDLSKSSLDFDEYTIADLIEDESLYLTNNLDDDEKLEYQKEVASFISFRRRKFRPSGNILIWDDVAKTRPVVGAKGMATRWFKRGQGISNSSGYWESSKRFRRKVRYKIKWDRYHYSIRRGQIGQANLRGPRCKCQWNITITGKRDKYHALIHQAAHDYYYGSRFGLSSPPRNSFFRTQMKIAARPHEGSSSALHPLRSFGIWPFVSINRYNSRSDKIYAVTAHELAHTAHWNMDRGAYNNLGWDGYVRGIDGDKRTMESWASGVEVMFALQRYKNQFGLSWYNYDENNLQRNTINEEPFYTSIVYDMIDNFNQRTEYSSSLYPNDNVYGYSILQVERGLRGARSWNAWRSNMINRHYNSTEQYVYQLFCNWDSTSDCWQ